METPKNSYGKNVYLINIGDIVTIERKDFEKDGKKYAFYNIPLKKWYMGKERIIRREVKFPREIGDIKDGTKIKILSMFEDVRIYKNIPIWSYMINEYEIVEEPDLNEQTAVLDYQQQLEENKNEMDFSNIIS